MKVRELLEKELCVDVVDDVCEELCIAFDGPAKLTPEGEKEFAEALELEAEDVGDGIMIIHVEDREVTDRVIMRRLRSVKRLFNCFAGYCSEEHYALWFEEPEDDDDDEAVSPEQKVKLAAMQLLRDRFPSYWGAFGSDFYDEVANNVKESAAWPEWNDNDVSLAVQRVIVWRMRKEGE